MLEESKDLIIKNFLILMRECDVDVLKKPMISKGIFSESEIIQIFSGDDARHNKRVFFFTIQKKEQKSFDALLESLKETNQHRIAKLLLPDITGCHPFALPLENNVYQTVSENVKLHVSSDTESLNIKVVPSTEFLDTIHHNKKLKFYTSRSKKRGRVLIINNYEYADGKRHRYRNGAKTDNKNLQDLFNQMGGWEIEEYVNQTKEEIIYQVTRFAKNKENNQYDICFVIVMGHGGENLNQTIIYGIDGNSVSADDIQSHFTNEKCLGFRGKPKVFLFQVCRGGALSHMIRHTETDSAQYSAQLSTSNKEVIDTHIRRGGDILTGYATLHGFKAHRDSVRGSWYIELICKNFMNSACTHSVSELLQLVDQDLGKRMSEGHTMQTSEHSNKGFKNLYLNPGIYYEDGILKHFNR